MTLHIMCDPIHGIMEIDQDAHKILKLVIDSRYFQRLRHIKQLSFAEFAYPGAVHNRFSHCIGASYLANKMYNALGFAKKDKEMRCGLPLAALMHDIGHGPFSHIFERVVKEFGLNISHETWSSKFMTQILQDHPDYSSALTNAKNIFERKSEPILSKIISSQLDVDRLDYLLRDSHFCGVSYGNFDLYWLISCIKKNGDELVISQKGIRALEHYIMARRLMNQNVYFHKIKCSAEYLLQIFFKTLSKNLNELSKVMIIENSLFTHFFQDAQKLKSSFKADQKLVEEDITQELFTLYEKLADHDFWVLAKGVIEISEAVKDSSVEFIKEIGERFFTRNLPKAYRINPGFDHLAQTIINEGKDHLGLSEIDNERLCLIKHSIGIYKTKGENIFVEHKKNSYCNVLQHSHLLKLIPEEEISYLYYIESPNKVLNKAFEKIFTQLNARDCLVY